MYLIKNIYFDNQIQNVVVENGIRVGVLQYVTKLIVADPFWGETDIWLGSKSEFAYWSESKGKYTLLPYVDEYEVKPLKDGFKEFSFNVSEFQQDNLEGYIIFIKSSNGDIISNGEKLFQRYSTEIVVVLRDGQYVEFDGKRIQVTNKQLVMLI